MPDEAVLRRLDEHLRVARKALDDAYEEAMPMSGSNEERIYALQFPISDSIDQVDAARKRLREVRAGART